MLQTNIREIPSSNLRRANAYPVSLVAILSLMPGYVKSSTTSWRNMEEWRCSSILDVYTRWRCVVSLMPLPLYPQGRSLYCPLLRRLGGPQSWSGHWNRDKSLVPAGNRNTGLQPVAISELEIGYRLSLWILNYSRLMTIFTSLSLIWICEIYRRMLG
jgi:hypothetical protein